MKNLLLAAIVAASSILPFAAASQAASVTVRTVERVDHRRDYHPRPRHNRKDCFVKKVRIKEHGRTIVRTTRVCR